MQKSVADAALIPQSKRTVKSTIILRVRDSVFIVFREARRQGGLPAPGNFLALCTRHRSWFQHAQARMHDLLEIRQNAEDILIKLGDDRVTDLGVPCDDDW
jgi:hypothetical protein